MNKMTPEELEKFIHQQLCDLPARRAPSSLEARVRMALEQRASIPWYHKSWSHWPAAFRTAFIVVASGVMGGVVMAFHAGFIGVNASAAVAQAEERLSVFTKIYHVATWIADLGAQVFGSIPPLWLYSSLAIIAVLYALFFGLGAAAYRMLYRNN